VIWLVQADLHREEGHAQLLDALNRLGSEYIEVTLPPGRDSILSGGQGVDLTGFRDKPVFVIGSYKLVRLARTAGLTPAAYTEYPSVW